MLRFWDYRCPTCGRVYRDQPVTGEHVPPTMACACGGRAEWTFMRKNHIHATHRGMKYGEFDPQFGCVVEDYGHRQRLLRERGMVDAGGPETMDQIMERTFEQQQRTRTERTPDVLAADSLEEIGAKIDRDRIDRKHTGRLTGRADQDPQTGLLPGLTEL